MKLKFKLINCGDRKDFYICSRIERADFDFIFFGLSATFEGPQEEFIAVLRQDEKDLKINKRVCVEFDNQTEIAIPHLTQKARLTTSVSLIEHPNRVKHKLQLV